MIEKEKLKKVVESKELYHIYIEGDYLYMIKSGDCKDEIPKTRILRDRGVNFAGPISQFKLDDGLYLLEEHLAKGVNLEKYSRGSNCNINYTPEEIEVEYLNFFLPYFNEIKERALASQEVYDKLISDIEEMNKEGLTIDTCSLGNLFFDKNIGYTIIDAYPYNGTNTLNVKQLYWLIRGNSPDLTFKYSNKFILRAIPYSLYEEFNNNIKIIKQKYINALNKYHINYDIKDFNYDETVINVDTINELLIKENDHMIRI